MTNKSRAASGKKASPKLIGGIITARAAAIVLILAVVLIALALYYPSAPARGGEWASFIGNYNNSRMQSDSIINSSNIGSIKQQWFINTKSPVTSTPLVLSGVVYFADWQGDVFAVNLTKGTVIWEADLNPYVSQISQNTSGISSTLAASEGILYVGDGLGSNTQPRINMIALNQSSGNVIWVDGNSIFKSSMNSMWGSPTVYDGMVYIGTSGTTWPPVPGAAFKRGAIYALNAKNGTKIWNVTLAVGNTEGAGVWSTPVVDPQLNAIYFGTGNAGQYNGTNNNYAYAIISMNASTGKKNWVYPAYTSTTSGGDFDFGSTPNLFTVKLNNVVYPAVGIGNKDGNYYIVDMLNGTPLQITKIADGGDGIIGVAGFTYFSTDNPEVYIPSYYKANASVQGAVTAFLPDSDANAWQFYTPGVVVGSVTLIPGAVLFGDEKGNFYAVNSATGAQLLHIAFPNTQINAGTTVAEGYIIIPTSFGTPSDMGVYGYTIPD